MTTDQCKDVSIASTIYIAPL